MNLKANLNNDNANRPSLEENRQSCGMRKIAKWEEGLKSPYQACNRNGNILLPFDEQEQDSFIKLYPSH